LVAVTASLSTIVIQASGEQTKERPLRISKEVPAPKRIKVVAPKYPADAKTGIVIVELVVTPEGRVDAARALRELPGSTEAALTAVKQWEYEPLVADGQAAWFVMVVTVPNPWRE
jgi:TonB family protein